MIFTQKQTIIENLSQNFKTKLLQQNKETLSNEEINKYFDEVKELSESNVLFKEESSTQSLLDTFILLLIILLLLFIFFGYLLNQTIDQSLGSLKHGMTKFFNYVIHNEQKIDKIDVIYNDEVGENFKFY